MIFANSQAWHLLWLVPLIALVLHLFYQHRQRMTSRFAQEHLIEELSGGSSIRFYRTKAALVMAAFVLMVGALSRPQWGYHEGSVTRHGLDIMVAMDVSKSMLTQDVKPSRLERSKLAVRDLVMKLGGADHIGLIAFAGDAMLMCPLTYDYNGFLLSLDDLSVATIPRGGTDIAAAVDQGIAAYKGKSDSELLRMSGMRTDKAVVLITDGEEQEGDALAAARRAKESGIRIFTVGVGTREGDLIQVTDPQGQTGFLKDADGNVVKSHLNENLLKQIAYITGGAYIRSGAEEFGLDYLYDRQLSQLKKHDAKIKKARVYDERFQWPLTLAFVLLLVETLFLNRKDSLRKIFPIFIFGIVVLTLGPSPSLASVAGEVNKANSLYSKGEFDDSLKLYRQALDQDSEDPIVKYDLGTALYKKGDYDKALKYLQQVSQDKNLKFKTKAEYNLGNALFKSGVQKEKSNVTQAIKTLQEALGHYGEVIAQDPKDQDAVFNQDIVKKEIQRLKQQQQKQQQKNQQQKNQQQKNQQQQKQQSQNQQNQNQQGQQNKENRPNQQEQENQKNQQQQQEKPQPSKPNDQQVKNSLDQAEKSQKELDRKEAEDLLDEYKENEEPKKLLNYMPRKIDDRPVVKDW